MKFITVPGLSRLDRLYRRATLPAKLLVGVFSVLLLVGTVGQLAKLQAKISVEKPKVGGTLHEGIVGTPEKINPVLARSQAEKDVTALLFSGLLEKTPEGVTTDLAESFQTEAGMTYTFKLKPGLKFHDGTPLTAEDVVFTIRQIQDPQIQSPLQSSWQNVVVEKIDSRTVQFTLPKSYPDFLDNFTLGIIPKHAFEETTAEEFRFHDFNTNPIGSGPYKLANLEKTDDAISRLTLARFKQYPDPAKIEEIIIDSFANQNQLANALAENRVDAAAGLPASTIQNHRIPDVSVQTADINRQFSIFFNHANADVLIDRSVRRALALAIPKEKIIEDVYAGYGTPIAGPLYHPDKPSDTTPESLIEKSSARLVDGVLKYQGDPVEITLETADTKSLKQVADLVAESWRDLGVKTTVGLAPIGKLSRETIRPRNYGALLFGQTVADPADLYTYWHSSNQQDPGLNFALYANKKADTLLAKLRSTSSPDTRRRHKRQLTQRIRANQPAAFVFRPEFIYALPERLEKARLPTITSPEQRYATVENWYLKTKQLWRVFE